MPDWKLHWMHIEFFAKHYRGEKFHALLCDPPYHLHSITKRFGRRGAAGVKDKDGAFKRASRGFMGMGCVLIGVIVAPLCSLTSCPPSGHPPPPMG